MERYPIPSKATSIEEPAAEALVEKVGVTKRRFRGSGIGKTSAHRLAEQALGAGGGGVAGTGVEAHAAINPKARRAKGLIVEGILCNRGWRRRHICSPARDV
jgi:hypothetical protein